MLRGRSGVHGRERHRVGAPPSGAEARIAGSDSGAGNVVVSTVGIGEEGINGSFNESCTRGDSLYAIGTSQRVGDMSTMHGLACTPILMRTAARSTAPANLGDGVAKSHKEPRSLRKADSRRLAAGPCVSGCRQTLIIDATLEAAKSLSQAAQRRVQDEITLMGAGVDSRTSVSRQGRPARRRCADFSKRSVRADASPVAPARVRRSFCAQRRVLSPSTRHGDNWSKRLT